MQTENYVEWHEKISEYFSSTKPIKQASPENNPGDDKDSEDEREQLNAAKLKMLQSNISAVKKPKPEAKKEPPVPLKNSDKSTEEKWFMVENSKRLPFLRFK